MTTIDIRSDQDLQESTTGQPSPGEPGETRSAWPPPGSVPAGEDLAERWVHIEPKGGRRRWLRLALTAALMALLAAGLTVTTTMLVHDQRIDSARSSALATATTDARLLGTFRYQHITADLKAMEQASTPAFAKQYASAQSNLTKLLTQYKANSIGSVVATAVKSVSPHKAVVLAFIDQAVTNSAVGSTPKSEPSRVIMTLVRSGGKWLISNVQIV